MDTRDNIHDPMVLDGLKGLLLSNLDTDIDLELHELEEEIEISKRTTRSGKQFHNMVSRMYRELRMSSGTSSKEGLELLLDKIGNYIAQGIVEGGPEKDEDGPSPTSVHWERISTNAGHISEILKDHKERFDTDHVDPALLNGLLSAVEAVIKGPAAVEQYPLPADASLTNDLLTAKRELGHIVEDLKAYFENEGIYTEKTERTALVEKDGELVLERSFMTYDLAPFILRANDVRSDCRYHLTEERRSRWKALLDRTIPTATYDLILAEYLLLSKQQMLEGILTRLSPDTSPDTENKGIEHFKLKRNDISLKNEIYTLLADHGFIDPSRDNRNRIVSFFTHKNTKDEKIVWKSNISDLNRFIKILEVYSDVPDKKKWEITASYFCKKDGQDVAPSNIKSFGNARFSDSMPKFEKRLIALFV